MKHFSTIAALATALTLAAPSAALALTPVQIGARVEAGASTSVGTRVPPKTNPVVTPREGDDRMRQASTTPGAAGMLKQGGDMTAAIAAGGQMIDARIASLNQLKARINGMTRLTSDQKASLGASIDASIAELNTLKAKIQGDTASSTLLVDLKSITQGNRIYGLVEPQLRILAATDRAGAVSDMLSAFATKVDARLATTPNAEASTALADLKAKITAAQGLAQAAIAQTSGLKPDNGNQDIKTANQAAIKDAMSKLVEMQKDLAAAQADVKIIVKALGGIKGSTTASTTVR